MQDAQFPVLLKGSRYAERLPIGKPEIIRNVNRDRLKQFYTDWYRPDLMAVDRRRRLRHGRDRGADQVALRLDSRAASPAAAGRRSPCPISRARAYSVVTDPEATNTRISVIEHDGGARSDDASAPTGSSMVERLFGGDAVSDGWTRSRRRPMRRSCGAQTDRALLRAHRRK